MPAKLIKVRPTKIALINLRRRLNLSSRIQKIIKDRLSILTLEFLQVARETVEAKRKLLDDFSELYRAMSITAGYHGYISLATNSFSSDIRNMAGMKIPTFEYEDSAPDLKNYSIPDTSSFLDNTAQLSQKCLEDIIALAELENNLALMGQEINRTKRIVNALEYLILPSLRYTIKYLTMKFEERDREEKARLKRVKVLLAKRK
ncbi:MAG: V-type ATP synthase subunit D [Dehalococcoidia bacterium]